MRYPATLTPDDGTVLVTFDDVPEAITFGEDEADALARASEALAVALGTYITDRRDLPTPSAANGRPMVGAGLLAEMKLAVYEAMRAKGWRKADLARSLATNPRQIDRLFDLTHVSTVTQIEAALAATGQRAKVELEVAA